ncbi:MAG TPA: hypothetical protein VLU73_04560 [Methylococcaceae bacterium]|jgi:hypothetical protein|nr:hypothetical protein [Methylococcaceae bacterium]
MKANKTSIKNYSLMMIAVGALAFEATASVRAQEITNYPSGISSATGLTVGFVCEGVIQDKGDNRINCSGPIYRADEYAAKYARQSSEQLVKVNAALDQLNASLDKLNRTSEATRNVLGQQAEESGKDLKAYIGKQFQELPKDMQKSAAIQNLRKSLTDYVDQRSKAPDNPPPPGPAAP